MTFALETQHGKKFRYGVRIEEMLIVHKNEIEIVSNFPVKQITVVDPMPGYGDHVRLLFSLSLKGGGWRRRRRVGVPPLGTFGACGVTPHPTRHSASKTRVNALKAGRPPPFRGRFGEDAMSEFILPLSSVEALDPDRVGPKAANLARL